MAYNNNLIREKLIDITNRGLQLKAIALNAGLDANDLSHFKNGSDCLKYSDIKMLSEYLDAVYIPQWIRVPPVKRKATKLELLQKRMNKEPARRRTGS